MSVRPTLSLRSRHLWSLIGLLLIVMLAVVAAVPARAATVPTVQYTKLTGRKVIYANNPEKLIASDRGDSTNRTSLLRLDNINHGNYRDFFQHLNTTGVAIAYGVYVYNPSSTLTVRLTRTAKGWTTNTDQYVGGKPFVQMYNSAPEAANLTLAPLAGGWIYRTDLIYGSPAGFANSGAFLSGAFEFSLDTDINSDVVSSNSVIVQHVIFNNPANLPTSYNALGYTTRSRGTGEPTEARTYKGLIQHAQVETKLDFTISDTDKGDLPVTYPRYVADASGVYVPGGAITRPIWYTHDVPFRDRVPSTGVTESYVVANDMVTINLPSWGDFNPLTRSSDSTTSPTYPNLGNWGIIYRTHGTIFNSSFSTTRTVAVKVGIYNTTDSDNANLAYKSDTGSWIAQRVSDGGSLPYRTFSVGPRQSVPYEALFVLGGPADGRLYQAISLTN